MKIDIYSYTNKGTREHNEDYFEVYRSEQLLTAVLCDGLGGHNCGEIASKTAAENLIEGIKQLREINNDGISNVLKIVNDGLIKYQTENPEFSGMRTTAVGCSIVPENHMLYYFNVGDSRFYLFKNGILKYMSKDHSVSQLSVEMGHMTFNDIRFDADRSKLLKVLGENNIGRQVGAVYPPVQIENGDAFLLCSDGFWEYVLEEEMEADLAKSHTAEEWIKYMLVRLLLKRASENDNYTVVGGIIECDDKLGSENDDLREWTKDPTVNKHTTLLPQTVIDDDSGRSNSDGQQYYPSAEPPMMLSRKRQRGKKKKRRKKKRSKTIVLRIKFTKANIVILVCIAVAIIMAITALLSAEFFKSRKSEPDAGAGGATVIQTDNEKTGVTDDGKKKSETDDADKGKSESKTGDTDKGKTESKTEGKTEGKTESKTGTANKDKSEDKTESTEKPKPTAQTKKSK